MLKTEISWEVVKLFMEYQGLAVEIPDFSKISRLSKGVSDYQSKSNNVLSSYSKDDTYLQNLFDVYKLSSSYFLWNTFGKGN